MRFLEIRRKSYNFVVDIIRREIARSRAQVLEINRFLDLQREEFEELLASRPEDLMLLMESQAQEKSRGMLY